MRTIYLDKTEVTECVGIFIRDTEVIPAGATVSSMSVRHKNSEYQRYADEYDIHFIFDDRFPPVPFYAVPQVDIFATDSRGGFIGSLGGAFARESQICYIDKNRHCFLFAGDGRQFLSNPKDWKSRLTPCATPELFQSREEAAAKYEFLDYEAVQQSLKLESK